MGLIGETIGKPKPPANRRSMLANEFCQDAFADDGRHEPHQKGETISKGESPGKRATSQLQRFIEQT